MCQGSDQAGKWKTLSVGANSLLGVKPLKHMAYVLLLPILFLLCEGLYVISHVTVKDKLLCLYLFTAYKC